MIIVLKRELAEHQLENIRERLLELGLASQTVVSGEQSLLVVADDASSLPAHTFSRLDGVEKVIHVKGRYPLASAGGQVAVAVDGATIGGGEPVVIAGPCSVEGRAQIIHLASSVKKCGAKLLRGGAFKPRTSPYDFPGLGAEGLEYLEEARQVSGLPVVSEVMSAEQVELADRYVDIFQVGARNMYNYELLREVGRARRPVLLKRALSATLAELLQSAEYILLQGNMQVILCERGIRTFETHTRNTLDLSAVAALKSMTQLPVLVDPSHGTGRPELIRPMSRAAIACGADGLIIEVHDEPSRALSDGRQAITPALLAEICRDVKVIHGALNSLPDEQPGLDLPVLQASSI